MALKLTWSHVLWIWWAIFWRWLILNSFTTGIYALVVWAIFNLLGHGDWTKSNWTIPALYLSFLPSAWMAVRLGLQAQFKDFRVQVISPENTEGSSG